MGFRIATLNLEQNHKRWQARRELIVREMETLKPDVFALNEVCIPLQTGRWLQQNAIEHLKRPYALIQQSKVNSASMLDGEALLTHHTVIETVNLDYRTRDAVAQVVRIEIDRHALDVYVTHLYMSRGYKPPVPETVSGPLSATAS
jgi:endonuclease/exonuclease/phosphatase family metal-dependent hydrolase